jgi:hypothetical protein
MIIAMNIYVLSAILICAVAIAIYEIREQNRRMMQSLKDWLKEEKMLRAKKIEILKAALKSRIACLNWSKSSIESSFKIGIGSLEEVQRCDVNIKEAEELLLELEQVKL